MIIKGFWNSLKTDENRNILSQVFPSGKTHKPNRCQKGCSSCLAAFPSLLRRAERAMMVRRLRDLPGLLGGWKCIRGLYRPLGQGEEQSGEGLWPAASVHFLCFGDIGMISKGEKLLLQGRESIPEFSRSENEG